MPHVIVVSEGTGEPEAGTIMLRERVTAANLASDHYSRHLLERITWAIGDAHAAELRPPSAPRDTPRRAPSDADTDTDTDGAAGVETDAYAERSASVVTTAS